MDSDRSLTDRGDPDRPSGQPRAAGADPPDGPPHDAPPPPTPTSPDPPIGAPAVASRVRAVLSSLMQQRDRDRKSGRFVPGTLAASKTLARSEQFWSGLEPVKRDLAARVRTDLAID